MKYYPSKKDRAIRNWNIPFLATGKRTAGKGRSKRIGEYAAECRNMGYSIAMLELG